jgi:hypothetical protein
MKMSGVPLVTNLLVTNLLLTARTGESAMRAGRARWKIENETYG